MVKKQVIIDEFNTLITKLKHDISILEANTDNSKDPKDIKKETNAISFKIRNYHKVIKSLETFDLEEIDKSDLLKELPGIGKGTLSRIDEIIKNGILEEGHIEISNHEREIAKKIDGLMTITGIGPARAKELNKDGITLDMLLNDYKENQENGELIKNLTHHQIIGVKYYHQFMKRIKRTTISKIDKQIQKLLAKYLLLRESPGNQGKPEKKTKKTLSPNIGMTAVICGSYRRGLESSGDIDLLISGLSEEDDKKFDLIDFVKYLTEEGLIIDHLTEKGTTKFMGVCDKGYRIDIRFIPHESFGAALMYFTGSKTFNTLVRTEALKQGYTLEEYGLYPLITPSDKEADDGAKKKITHSHQHMKGERILCPTEESIFDVLKIDKKYLDPTNRNLDDNITSL
jgi:DNA polymerase beta